MLHNRSQRGAPTERPNPLNSLNEYLVLELGEETAAQAVVGFIVSAFRPRLYAPNFSVCPQLFFSFPHAADDISRRTRLENYSLKVGSRNPVHRASGTSSRNLVLQNFLECHLELSLQAYENVSSTGV